MWQNRCFTYKLYSLVLIDTVSPQGRFRALDYSGETLIWSRIRFRQMEYALGCGRWTDWL